VFNKEGSREGKQPGEGKAEREGEENIMIRAKEKVSGREG